MQAYWAIVMEEERFPPKATFLATVWLLAEDR